MVKVKNQENEMRTVIRDIIIYTVYIVIIFIISYGKRETAAYHMKEYIERAIVFGGINCDIYPIDDPR